MEAAPRPVRVLQGRHRRGGERERVGPPGDGEGYPHELAPQGQEQQGQQQGGIEQNPREGIERFAGQLTIGRKPTAGGAFWMNSVGTNFTGTWW